MNIDLWIIVWVVVCTGLSIAILNMLLYISMSHRMDGIQEQINKLSRKMPNLAVQGIELKVHCRCSSFRNMNQMGILHEARSMDAPLS